MNPDFEDLLNELTRQKADFMVIGAYAVSYYSQPRSTGDLDLLVNPNPDNAQRVLRALSDFGAPINDLTVEDLEKPGLVFQIGVPPRRIDIMTSISGVSYQEAWEGHAETAQGELLIPVIGKAALIKNKKAVGRPKDLSDLEMLQ